MIRNDFMNRYIFAFLFLFSLVSNANQTAVTDTGDIVILKSNGTWSFQTSISIKASEIPLSNKKYNKGINASFNLKSKVNNSQFSIDPKLWSFKNENDGQREYFFALRGKELWGMAITETTVFPVETLGEIALENARNYAPDAEIIFQEYRIVNGVKVLYQEFSATAKGIEFIYRGYYFSNKTGSTQYVAYTTAKRLSDYTNEVDEYLNGFSIQ